MLSAFALALSSAAGFIVVMATVVLGLAAGVPFGWSNGYMIAYTLYLSILAIVQGSTILVYQRREKATADVRDEAARARDDVRDKALHAKIDELIRVTPPARNDLMGLEERPEVDAMAITGATT